MLLPTLEEIKQATDLIAPYLAPTPQYRWPLLCQRCDSEVWVKHENTTPIGSFKIRGGLFYLSDLPDEHVIAATRGNHGQSVALAATMFGKKATVVVPRGNSVSKNMSMQAFGATLIEKGQDFDDALEYALQLSTRENAHLIPSFSRKLVTGVASCGLELFSHCSDLDAIYVPIGLGSEICAIISAREGLGLDTEIIGVVADNAPTYALSFASGEPVPTNSSTTIADGVAVRNPNLQALNLITQYVSRIIRVSETQIKDAMRAYFTDTHHVIEGAGAISLAALIKDKQNACGKRNAVIASGGNVDLDLYRTVLNGH